MTEKKEIYQMIKDALYRSYMIERAENMSVAFHGLQNDLFDILVREYKEDSFHYYDDSVNPFAALGEKPKNKKSKRKSKDLTY